MSCQTKSHGPYVDRWSLHTPELSQRKVVVRPMSVFRCSLVTCALEACKQEAATSLYQLHFIAAMRLTFLMVTVR